MQGAPRVVIAVVVAAGLVPAASSAQQPQGLGLPQLPAVELQPVQLPPVPLPAPLPPVSVPEVPAPEVRVPQPPLPAPPEVSAPLPQVTAPSAPRLDAPAAGSGPGEPPSAGSSPGSGTSGPSTSSGQAPSGTVAAAGTPSASPARGGRAARAAAVRGGRGLLGTSYHSRRRLVRALRGCIDLLPQRQERLVTIRYGLGGAEPRADRAVAGMLDLSSGQYVAARRRALRGLVVAARNGRCRVGRSVAAGSHYTSARGRVGPSVASVAVSGGPESKRAEIGVLGERRSGGDEAGPAERSGLGTPLALDADSASASLPATLVVIAALVVLGLIALRPLLAASSRRGGRTGDVR